MTAHCSTCTCRSEPVPPPATSSPEIRRMALQATDDAVARSKDSRKKPADKP
jgi:hypothetical protein